MITTEAHNEEAIPMMKRTKTMVAAGAVALALAGTGAGVAVAQTSTPAPGTPSTTNAAPNKPATKAHAPGAKKHVKGLLGKVEHGEFTTHTKAGDKVLDVQRGTVTAVNGTSITVKSTDGTSATYTTDPATKVRKDKKAAAVNQIAPKDRVQVVATKSGSTVTAQRIGDASPAK